MVSVYVEWDQDIFVHQADDGGDVYYSLDGTPNTFQLRACAPNKKFTLQAYFDNIATINNPLGSVIDLGWSHDGKTPFILSGTADNFSSSNPPSNWMQANLITLGPRPIRHLCIPGSHDAGMSVLTGGTAFATPGNTLTQTKDIGTQLTLGSRYFDFRPVITGGQFSAGHYSDIEVLGWQGGNGQKFTDIVEQVNSFTASNAELVVLNLSHDLNTDVGRDYRALDQGEWNRLFQELAGLNHLFVAPDPTSVDLTTLTLNKFIGNGQAAVVVILQPSSSSITLGDYANLGFYFYSQFNAWNSYSDTNVLDKMTTDQLNKLRQVRVDPDSQLFLLSWTLTQDAKDVIVGPSIIELAKTANPTIFTLLPPAVSSETYPNILYIDNFADSNVTALAIAINTIAGN